MMRNIILFLMLFMFLSTGCQKKVKDLPEREITIQSRASSEKAVLTTITEDIFYGEVIYIPIYSDIFHRDETRRIQLSATLSIHNTDLENSIVLTNVHYHDIKGRLIREYLSEPVILKPLETLNYMVEEKDKSGGSGANFIVEWQTDIKVSSPIVEAIMITTRMGQGISFMTTGKVVKRFGRMVNPE